MGREVRRVPKNWEHPKDGNGNFIPLFDGKGLGREQKEWDLHAGKWDEGLRDDWRGGWKPREGDEKDMPFEEWYGPRPCAENYMPQWPEEERTHLMMYESTTEGTPISPAFETPEELAQWLVDNRASSFAHMTATYEQWLSACRAGWTPSAVLDSTGLHSGVEALRDTEGAGS